jgi:hypothetical protein
VCHVRTQKARAGTASALLQPPHTLALYNFRGSMIIKYQSVISLMKTLIFSGTFGVISFICFFFTYWALKPELNLFITYLDSNNLSSWAHSIVWGSKFSLTTLAILVLSAITGSVGLFSAIAAKSIQEPAVEYFKKALKEP